MDEPARKPDAPVPVVPTGPTIERRSYLGASEIAAVAGIHPYKTALDVWAMKRGIVAEATAGAAAEVGTALERPILEALYAPRYGVQLAYPGTLTIPEEPWRGATPDAIEDGKEGVQLKVVGHRQAWRWGDETEGADGIPPEVLAQVHWEALAIRATLHVEAAVYRVPALLGTDLRRYLVPIDDDFAASLVELAREFWAQVEGDVMPEVSTAARDVVAAMYPHGKRGAKLLPATTEAERIAREYDRWRAKEAEAKTAKDAAGARMCLLIGDGAGFESDAVKATWQTQRGSPAWKAIAMELGATDRHVEAHRSEDHRVLRVRVNEEG